MPPWVSEHTADENSGEIHIAYQPYSEFGDIIYLGALKFSI